MEDKTDGTCSTHGKNKTYTQLLLKNLKQRIST